MMLVDGYVSQDRHPEMLQDIMIVPEEIDLPAVSFKDFIRTNRVYYPNFSEEVLHQVLRDFDIPAEFNLTALSMGQKKKVFMAFALATCTKYLLMDEPTNGLDIPGKAQFRQFLSEGRTSDSIFVVSTHQVKDIEQVLEHIVMFDDSEILANADIKSIFPDGNVDLERFFNERINQKMAQQ